MINILRKETSSLQLVMTDVTISCYKKDSNAEVSRDTVNKSKLTMIINSKSSECDPVPNTLQSS